MKIAIVVSETYWPTITGPMLKLAKEAAEEEEEGVETVIIKVPGTYDIPFGVLTVIENVDGVVTLGAVVQGQTAHDEVICNVVASKLLDLSLEFQTPVVLGINGPKMSLQNGIARISRAREVTKACIQMVKTLS